MYYIFNILFIIEYTYSDIDDLNKGRERNRTATRGDYERDQWKNTQQDYTPGIWSHKIRNKRIF